MKKELCRAITLAILFNTIIRAQSWSELTKENKAAHLITDSGTKPDAVCSMSWFAKRSPVNRATDSHISLVSIAYADIDDELHNALQVCHFASFKKAYEAYWSSEQEALIRKKFAMHMNNFKISDQHLLVVALQDEALLGWMLYKKESYGVYLELLCVAPDSCNKGIGKKFVLSLMDSIKNGFTVSLLSRKSNQVACSFYERLGFEKTDFMLPDYSAYEYQGYEKHKE